MGASHSREDLLESSDSEQEQEETYEDASQGSSERHPKTPSSSLDDVEAKLKALKLKYSSNPAVKNAVKLYLHVGGISPKAKWVTTDKLTTYSFVKTHSDTDTDSDEEEYDEEPFWVLKVGSKVRSMVGPEMGLKNFADQRRVDFVARGVWAMKFFTEQDHAEFMESYEKCLFENTHGVEATDENKLRIYGKDFIVWAKPEAADDSMWEDAEEAFAKSPTPVKQSQDLHEEFEEASNGGIQSLALGALDNSFLKTLLMRAETNMLLMSPMDGGKLHSTGLHQLDIETGKVVSEWKFGKDGTEITMRDITNDSKGAQLDPSGSTFLGLDDNRLCRWDMRDRNGMVQNLADSGCDVNAPVLNWAQGHQFSRGTNFQCFATTGDGSIVVGSLDGKIRLYSVSSMRQAKTAFPGLGSAITHVDVTFDGKWVVGTTDTYLVLICTLFSDKEGRTKTGFTGRMGNKIAAPRLLKLTPLDSHLAGGNNKFRNAQFSWVTENGKQERHIVATVGKFSVIWNFQQVKDGSHECYRNQQGLKSCYCYKIVLRDDSIVESRFMHDKFAVTDSPEAPLVIATPMKVSSFSISSKR
ncbi:hypothetical protein Fmac_000405 [Flemingia macrophylla]|uniref:Vacuolar import/degradation Vid27 C-terminal domain-containing protein n=1 Tax=Flemingia macrophylla TaxID=520843 RepID=A0ABD1NE66_9FABA